VAPSLKSRLQDRRTGHQTVAARFAKPALVAEVVAFRSLPGEALALPDRALTALHEHRLFSSRRGVNSNARRMFALGPDRSAHGRTGRQMLRNRPPSSMDWHRWFAWRPVVAHGRTGRRQVVWLQYLERKWTLGRTSGLGPRWIYRVSGRVTLPAKVTQEEARRALDPTL
jgi:hypothetical protein